MAFPTTGILDPFTYANNASLVTASGGAWGTLFGLDFNVNSNAIFPNGSSGLVLWQALSIASAEAYALVSQVPSSGDSVACAWLSNGGDGYVVTYQHGAPGFMRITRSTGFAPTTLGADVSLTIATNDSIGLYVSAGTIEGWHHNGASWSLILTRSDGTHTTARRIGITTGGVTSGITDFGGGAPVAGGSPVGPLLQGKLVGGGILQGRLVR